MKTIIGAMSLMCWLLAASIGGGFIEGNIPAGDAVWYVIGAVVLATVGWAMGREFCREER